jgi:hypothetical protein
MNRRPKNLLALLAAGALVAIVTAGAGDAAPASALSYDDDVEDVLEAPDISAVNLITNDNVSITIGVHIRDRSTFRGLDAYSVALDTDSNPATGGGADYRVAGAEYVVDLAEGSSRLMIWTGSSYELVTPQPLIPTMWIEGYGPVIRIARAALGDPRRVDVVLRTASGLDVDLAPDAGAWSYTVKTLELIPGGLVVGRTQSGTRLVAAMEVLRSDFDAPLDEGAIHCSAKAGGTRLHGRGLFVDQVVVCSWRLPSSVRGRRVSGTVAVTFQGATASRSFNRRIRARD